MTTGSIEASTRGSAGRDCRSSWATIGCISPKTVLMLGRFSKLKVEIRQLQLRRRKAPRTLPWKLLERTYPLSRPQLLAVRKLRPSLRTHLALWLEKGCDSRLQIVPQREGIKTMPGHIATQTRRPDGRRRAADADSPLQQWYGDTVTRLTLSWVLVLRWMWAKASSGGTGLHCQQWRHGPRH